MTQIEIMNKIYLKYIGKVDNSKNLKTLIAESFAAGKKYQNDILKDGINIVFKEANKKENS